MDTKALKQKILDLAIHGRLVPQDPNDEPASILLQRIREEKQRLIKEGKIKKGKKTEENAHDEDVPFEVPEGWVWCRLVDSCHIAGRIGFRGYAKDDLVGEQEGAITLSPSNITDGHMDYTKCTYISWHKYEESPEIQVNNGDILLVKTGSSYGKCALVGDLPWKATINPQFVVLKYISINPQYLTWILQSSYARKNYDAFVLGTAIPTFTQVVLGNLRIPLPPLTEQRRIVAEIERWFGLIDIVERGKESLKSAVQSAKSKILDLAIHGRLVPQTPNDEPASTLLQRINPKAEIVEDNDEYGDVPEGWCVTRIKDVFIINPKNKEKDEVLAGFVPMTNISEGFSNHFVYEVKNWGSIKTGFTHFSDGDIAVAKISPCLENRKSIVLKDLPNGIGAGTTELHVLRPLGLLNTYGLYFFKSDYFIKQCVGTFNGVVGQQRVGKNIVEQIPFPLPPLAEQHRIVAKIEELFVLLDKIESSL